MKGISLRIVDQYAALHSRAGFIEREDLGRLLVRGEDRRSYLHGLLTNDIQALAGGGGCYTALLTPQGRMITDMHVFELGDQMLVTLPKPLASEIRDRLDQFIFGEDVQVEDATGATVQFGVYGPEAATIVPRLPALIAPTRVAARDFGLDGFEIVAPRDRARDLAAALVEMGATGIDRDVAEISRVEAGIPRFLVEMTQDTIPLEAGIEERAISMTKGCYPGQEVIVRVLHRGGGRVAKKLVGILLPEDAPVPAAGETVRSGDRDIGAITSAVRSVRLGHPIALAYVHRDFAAAGTRVSVTAARGSGSAAEAEVAGLPFGNAEC